MELRIKEVCKEKGVTQKQLSELSGIAEVSLSKSINGNPTIGTLEKIATALGVEITELFSTSGSSGLTCPACGATLELKVKEE
ncbi:MAG: helix-turn-helix transcriptional regulator [Rikenellaceae bacterium]